MIPKIIHFCWFSNEPYPERIKKCIDSWKTYLPDYEIRHWGLKDFDFNKLAWTEEAFKEKKYAFVSDYIRLYALYNYGGIYLDSDVEVCKSFDDLLNYKIFLGYEFSGLPEAAIVGSETNQEWLKVGLEWYNTKHFKNQDNSLNMIVAPLICRYAFESVNECKLIDDGNIHSTSDYILLPQEFISPKDGFTGKINKTDNTYSIHHFNSGWVKKSFSIQVKRRIHIILRSLLGKNKYIKIMYNIHIHKWNKLKINQK